MNATLARYLAAVGLFTMSTGVTRPVFPLFAAGLGVGVVLIGVLNSVGVAANAVVRPLSGRLADRYGRITFIRGGLLFLVAGNVAYAVAPPHLAGIVLAAGSTAIGIGAAAFWPSLKATLVEHYLDRRERALGYITTTQGICTALGAAIGGVAATGLGYRWSFALGATSLLAAAIVIGRPPRRSARREAPVAPAETEAEAETAPARRRIPVPVIVIVAATALMNIALGAILTFLSLYANQVYHQPAAVIGLLFTFVFLGQALGGYLVGMASGTALLRRFGRRRLLVLVLGLAALCCLATPLFGFIAFGAAQTALAVLATVAGIVMMALSTELMSVTALGTVIGSVEAVGLSASLLGPVLGGALFQADRAAFFPVAGVVFAGALVLLIPAWSRLDTRDPVGDATG
jgi:MFS family permease